MPQILAEIGLEKTDIPDHSTPVKTFDRFKMAVWRVPLWLSAQLHDTASHAAMDAAFWIANMPANTTAAEHANKPGGN